MIDALPFYVWFLVFFVVAASILSVQPTRCPFQDNSIVTELTPVSSEDDFTSEPDDIFGFVNTRLEQPNYTLFGVPRIAVEDTLWKDSAEPSRILDAFSSLSHEDGDGEGEMSCPSPTGSSVFAAVRTICASFAARCSSTLSLWTVALRSQCARALIAGKLSSSASSCSDLSALLSEEPHQARRVFGMILPPRSPIVFGLEDLEIDDGDYLRSALDIVDWEGSGEAGFWPELDEYVARDEDEKPKAWYTDEDEIRGWIL